MADWLGSLPRGRQGYRDRWVHLNSTTDKKKKSKVQKIKERTISHEECVDAHGFAVCFVYLSRIHVAWEM